MNDSNIDSDYIITTEADSVSPITISSLKDDLQNFGYTTIQINFDNEAHLLRHARHDLLKSLSDHYPWIDDVYFDLSAKRPVEQTEGIGRVDVLPKSCLKLQCLPSITSLFSNLLSGNNILNTFDVPQLVPANQSQNYKGITIRNKPVIVGLLTLTHQKITKDKIAIQAGTLVLYKDSDNLHTLFPPNNTETTWLGLRIGYVLSDRDIYDSILRTNIFFFGRFGIHFDQTGISTEDMIYDARRLLTVMKPQMVKYFIGPNISTNMDMINVKFPQRRQLFFSNGVLQYFASDTQINPKEQLLFKGDIQHRYIDANSTWEEKKDENIPVQKCYPQKSDQAMWRNVTDTNSNISLTKGHKRELNEQGNRSFSHNQMDEEEHLNDQLRSNVSLNKSDDEAKNIDQTPQEILYSPKRSHVKHDFNKKQYVKEKVCCTDPFYFFYGKNTPRKRKHNDESMDNIKWKEIRRENRNNETNLEPTEMVDDQGDRYANVEREESNNAVKQAERHEQCHINMLLDTNETIDLKEEVRPAYEFEGKDMSEQKNMRTDEFKLKESVRRISIEIERNIFFQRAIERLNSCWDPDFDIQQDPYTVAHEIKLECEKKYDIPQVLYGHLIHEKTDMDLYSLEIMPHDAPANIYPRRTVGDGNCLFRSLSILLYGNEDRHLEMRVRTVVEMLQDIDYLLSDELMRIRYGNSIDKRLDTFMALTQLPDGLFQKTDVRNCEHDEGVMKNILLKTIGSSTRLNDWSGIWHIAAAARAINVPIVCIYPSEKVGIDWNVDTRLAFHRKFGPRECYNTSPVYIMATRLHKPKGRFWSFDHFVACLKWRKLNSGELPFVIKPTKGMRKEDDETITIEDDDVSADDDNDYKSDNDKTSCLRDCDDDNANEMNRQRYENNLAVESTIEKRHESLLYQPNDQQSQNNANDMFISPVDTEDLINSPEIQSVFLRYLEYGTQDNYPGHDILKTDRSLETPLKPGNVMEINQIKDNESELKYVLDVLEEVNKGAYSEGTDDLEDMNEIDCDASTVFCREIALSFEPRIQLLAESLKSFPFCRKFRQRSSFVPVFGMKIFERQENCPFPLPYPHRISSCIYFDVSQIKKPINGMSEELNSEHMRNTRCFVMHKSFPTKIIEIRGATTVHQLIKLFVSVSRWRKIDPAHDKAPKDTGVYSIFDRKDDGTVLYKYNLAPVERDNFYVIWKRPRRESKGENNFYDPMLPTDQPSESKLVTGAENDRKKFILSELRSQLSKIKCSRTEAIDKIKRRLNISRDITDDIANLESHIRRFNRYLEKFNCVSLMHDIVTLLDEQQTIVRCIDQSIVRNKMNDIAVKHINRLVEITYNIRKTTHSECIKRMYMGSKGDKTNIATYIINFILPDPDLHRDVIRYVNDQQFVN